jgi:ketosteroid isomerase-like protein
MPRKYPALALIFALAALPILSQAAPAFLANHHTNAADVQAIEHVLATYTESVTKGDEKAFAALLLDENIPFTYVDDKASGPTQAPDTRRYEDFRQAIFASGKKYQQQFYNVHIEQDGPLAQVSLDFVTRRAGTKNGSYGWKTLQLMKVGGEWKIASELYTGYALPAEG